MHKLGKKKILAVVEDLMFTVKISDAAKRAGLEVEFVKSERDVIEKATQEKPLLIILDLNFNAVQPLKLISTMKSDGEMKQISVIGYLSHVQHCDGAFGVLAEPAADPEATLGRGLDQRRSRSGAEPRET